MRNAGPTRAHLDVIREVGERHGIPEADVNQLIASYRQEKRGWWTRLKKTRAERNEAQTQATIEGMTGLYNRNAGMKKVSRFMGFTKPQMDKRVRTDRAHKEVNILAIDLNNLKRANDRYGHHVGDAYIKAAAEAIKGEGVAIRMGGDEMNLITEFQGHDHLKELRRRIHENAMVNFQRNLEGLRDKFVESGDTNMVKKVGRAMADLNKKRFSLAIGSLSIVKPENMPQKRGGRPMWIRVVARYIPNWMPLKPQEESGLFHATLDMDKTLGEHRTETPRGYIDNAFRQADLLGYLHKYTRKRKASSAFLAEIDAVRKKEAA